MYLPQGDSEHDAVLVVVDKFTKAVKLLPCSKTDTGTDILRLLQTNVFPDWGYPTKIVCNRDPRWTTELFKKELLRHGTRLAQSTAKHPQTDGQSEKMISFIKNIIAANDEIPWPLLPKIQLVINTTPSCATGLAPLEIIGRRKSESQSVMEEQELEMLQKTIFDLLVDNAHRMTTNFNGKPTFKEGDLAMISSKLLSTADAKYGTSSKLKLPFLGPFRVNKVVNEQAFSLELPPYLKLHRTINIEYLKPFKGDMPESPGPVNDELEHPEWEVEEILAHRKRGRGFHFLCKWKGYAREHATWEPERHLQNAPTLLNAYKQNNMRK